MAKDLNQAVNKLNDELFSMSAVVSDWGPWDDTVDFVNGKDPNYLNSNLQSYSFDNLNLNLIVITNTKGEVIFSGAYDLRNLGMVPVPALFSGKIDPENPLMNQSDPHQITSGIVMLPEGPMLVVSQPIVRSDFSGPVQGVVIMGRYLNREEIMRLAELTQPSLTFTRIDDPALSPTIRSRIHSIRGSPLGIVETLNANQVAGYAPVKDIYGNDVLVLQITETRDIYHQGINTTMQVILIILTGGLFLGLVVVILLDRVLLKRMGSLALQVHKIGQPGYTRDHVELDGDDELSGLAVEINGMLDTIQKTQAKVLASEVRFRELAELLPLIIFEMDLNGNLKYVNKTGVELFGINEQKILQGTNIRQYLSPENSEQMQRGLSVVMYGGKSPGEIYTLTQIDGNLMRAIVHTSLIHREGKVTGFRGVVLDISERKRAEDAIELANKKLNLMNNIIRHDILNTITGLLGCVDMATATTSSEEKMQLLADIKDLTRTIQRQIAFTKEYQEVGVHLPLWQNVNVVITHMLENFKNSSLTILVDLENTEIYADPLLEKVFYNLVDNAIRYGDTVTTIIFEIRISDKGLSIICEDNGAGILPEEKMRIFERGVGRNTGMGLFLTREILGITGITIVENGEFKKGARFEIHIPRGTFRFVR